MTFPPLSASVAQGENSCRSGSGDMGGITPFPGTVVSHQGWTPLVRCLLGHPGNILALIGSLSVWGPGSYAFDGLQPHLEWGNLPNKQAMTPSHWEAMGLWFDPVES